MRVAVRGNSKLELFLCAVEHSQFLFSEILSKIDSYTVGWFGYSTIKDSMKSSSSDILDSYLGLAQNWKTKQRDRMFLAKLMNETLESVFEVCSEHFACIQQQVDMINFRLIELHKLVQLLRVIWDILLPSEDASSCSRLFLVDLITE